MFEKLIPVIKNADNIAIFSHSSPDGDAMGSSYGLKLILAQIGKNAEVFLQENPDVPAESLMIKGGSSDLKIEDCDLFIALDSGDSERLGRYEKVFLSHDNTIAIDHHETHEEYAKLTVVEDISSTCELIVRLAEELGAEITKDIANNLYIGLVTDTGNFRYSCISGDTLRAAADLIDTGLNFSEISKILFETKSKEYYSLLKIALDKLKFYCGGKAAVLFLSSEDYKSADISEAEAVGIVNIPNSIVGVEVGVFIRNRGENEYKVSLRSNRYVNVANIAMQLGGGGHERASGYSAKGKTIDEIVLQVIEELEKVI
ncbi:MAG: bifunctional oligoribonuclease/PAP phosphatase NrnA [Clostridiales bacterium]|nr:bifunctional oligoribonuclease/PAP phosphatase NrnA [Clostridiales bacterium]